MITPIFLVFVALMSLLAGLCFWAALRMTKERDNPFDEPWGES
jgi:hypothetical protein